MQKKKWAKPELIVLVRGKPEERVLMGCKLFGSHLQPGGLNNACDTSAHHVCGACLAYTGS